MPPNFGDCSDETKRGEVPDDNNAKGAYIEWAAWKVLAMRADLHVLVAYPFKDYDRQVIKVLEAMLRGWDSQYGTLPNALFLLWWWSDPIPINWRAESYTAYVPTRKNDIVALAPLNIQQPEVHSGTGAPG